MITAFKHLNFSWKFESSKCTCTPNINLTKLSFGKTIVSTPNFNNLIINVKIFRIMHISFISKPKLKAIIHSTSINSLDRDKNRIFGSCKNLLARIHIKFLRCQKFLLTMHSQLSFLSISPSKYFISFYCQTVVQSCTYLFYSSHNLSETVTVLFCSLTICTL